jgi:hypothetical protein
MGSWGKLRESPCFKQVNQLSSLFVMFPLWYIIKGGGFKPVMTIKEGRMSQKLAQTKTSGKTKPRKRNHESTKEEKGGIAEQGRRRVQYGHAGTSFAISCLPPFRSSFRRPLRRAAASGQERAFSRAGPEHVSHHPGERRHHC